MRLQKHTCNLTRQTGGHETAATSSKKKYNFKRLQRVKVMQTGGKVFKGDEGVIAGYYHDASTHIPSYYFYRIHDNKLIGGVKESVLQLRGGDGSGSDSGFDEITVTKEAIVGKFMAEFQFNHDESITDDDYYENLAALQKGDLCLVMMTKSSSSPQTSLSSSSSSSSLSGPRVELLSFYLKKDDDHTPDCYVFIDEKKSPTITVTEGCIVHLTPSGMTKASILVELAKVEQEEFRHRDPDHEMLQALERDTVRELRKQYDDFMAAHTRK